MNEKLFPERLKTLRTEKGITLEELARKIGTTKTTLSRYENGERSPKLQLVGLLANYFQVDMSWLSGQSTYRNSLDILSTYNQLEKPRQEKVYRFAEHQLEEQEKQKQNSTTDNNVLEFEEYRNKKIISGRSTAAGPPIDGDTQDSQAAVMVVDQREVPKNADEIVTIAGDSMEPLILQGEQVFIHWTPVIEQGDIALVSIIDEGVTCKKVYWDDKEFTLHSINEAYEDMVYPLSDVRIIGKVL